MKKIKKIIGYFLYVFIGSWLPHYQLGRTWIIPKKIRQISGRLFFERCGKNVDIGRRVKLSPNIWLGDNSSIGDNSFIQGKVKIGKNVMMAQQCMIIGINHNFDDLNKNMNQQGENSIGIEIADNVWIGARVTILDGVKIAEGTVIAAGAVVTKDTDKNTVVGGVPAKFIRKRGINKES